MKVVIEIDGDLGKPKTARLGWLERPKARSRSLEHARELTENVLICAVVGAIRGLAGIDTWPKVTLTYQDDSGKPLDHLDLIV